MDNIQPVARSLRPVPIVKPAASHTVFAPVQQAEYGPAQRHVEGGRSHPVDTADISPEAMRAHRAQFTARQMHLCEDCELVHAKGQCPLDVPPLEERCDWNPQVDPELGRALLWSVGVLIVTAAIVAVLNGWVR